MQIVQVTREPRKTIAELLSELPVRKDKAMEVEKKKVHSVRSAITRLHSDTRMRFETEKIEGNPKKEGWINVWRTQ